MELRKNSAQDEPILKDQFPLLPPFTTLGGGEFKKKKGSVNSKPLCCKSLLSFKQACGRTRPEKVLAIKEAMDTKVYAAN